jgi:hypothetical protein
VKKPEETKPTYLNTKIAAIDTTQADDKFVTPSPESDMDDIDDEVSKITKTIHPSDIDWTLLS